MLNSIIQIVSTILVAIEVFLVYRQTRLVAKQLKAGNEWNKVQATLSTVEKYGTLIGQIEDSVLDQIKLIALQPHDVSINEMTAFLADTTKRKQLFLLCDFFEELSIGVRLGYLNEEVAYQQLYTPVVHNYENLQVYIQVRRAETKVNVLSNYEWLAKRWRKMETGS